MFGPKRKLIVCSPRMNRWFFAECTGLNGQGMWSAASDPHRELAGQNVLFLQNDRELVAKLTGRSEEEVSLLVSAARKN